MTNDSPEALMSKAFDDVRVALGELYPDAPPTLSVAINQGIMSCHWLQELLTDGDGWWDPRDSDFFGLLVQWLNASAAFVINDEASRELELVDALHPLPATHGQFVCLSYSHVALELIRQWRGQLARAVDTTADLDTPVDLPRLLAIKDLFEIVRENMPRWNHRWLQIAIYKERRQAGLNSKPPRNDESQAMQTATRRRRAKGLQKPACPKCKQTMNTDKKFPPVNGKVERSFRCDTKGCPGPDEPVKRSFDR